MDSEPLNLTQLETAATHFDTPTLIKMVDAVLQADQIEWCKVHDANWEHFHEYDGQIRRCRYAQGAGLRNQCDSTSVVIVPVVTP